jgi:hypothetical protein
VNDWRCLEKRGRRDGRIFPVAVGRPRVGCVSAAPCLRCRLRRRLRRRSEGRVETRGSRLALPVPILHNDTGWTVGVISGSGEVVMS